METLTIQGTGVTDTYFESNSPTSNYGSSVLINAGEQKSATVIYRTAIKFDISSIPSNATISSAVLSLYSDGQDLSDQSRTFRIYRIKQAWVEDQVTWNIYSTGNNWGNAGCADTTNDREATDIGSATHPANPIAGTEVQFTLTASKIQEMLTGGSFTNNGFLLKADTESDDAGSFYSTQYSTAAQRPKLVIQYSVSGENSSSFLLNFI